MTIEYDRRGPVAVVTIDRPGRRNAVDDATAEELGDAWDRFDEDDTLVGSLTGSEGTSSPGADLRATDLEDRPEEVARVHPQARLEADGRGRQGPLRRRRPRDGAVV